MKGLTGEGGGSQGGRWRGTRPIVQGRIDWAGYTVWNRSQIIKILVGIQSRGIWKTIGGLYKRVTRLPHTMACGTASAGPASASEAASPSGTSRRGWRAKGAVAEDSAY